MYVLASADQGKEEKKNDDIQQENGHSGPKVNPHCCCFPAWLQKPASSLLEPSTAAGVGWSEAPTLSLLRLQPQSGASRLSPCGPRESAFSGMHQVCLWSQSV